MKRFGGMALLAALLVGCGGDAAEEQVPLEDPVAQVPEQPAAAGNVIPESGDPSVARGSVGGREYGQVVNVRVTAEGLTLDRDTLPEAGQVTFVLHNEGGEPFQLHVVRENAGQWKSMPVGPGGEMEMSMVLNAGAYDVQAPAVSGGTVPAGMKKRLVIR